MYLGNELQRQRNTQFREHFSNPYVGDVTVAVLGKSCLCVCESALIYSVSQRCVPLLRL